MYVGIQEGENMSTRLARAATILAYYYREVVATWLLNAAMWIAPKRMRLHIARGLYTEMQAYAEILRGEL